MQDRKLTGWKVEGWEESTPASSSHGGEGVKAALERNFEFRLPLSWLLAAPGSTANSQAVEQKPGGTAIAPASRLRLRVSLWHNRLPVDALPVEGWIELQLLSEAELGAG